MPAPPVPSSWRLWLLFGLGLLVAASFPPKSGRERLVLGSWSPPENLDRDYFYLLAELGFTHTLYWRSPEIDPKRWKEDLDRAREVGLRLVFDSWQPDRIPETWLQRVLETACGHPAFAGVYAPDEPGYRYPLEKEGRRPQPEAFRWSLQKVQECGQGELFQVDAAAAESRPVEMFLPFCTVFGLDVYPYRQGVDWRTQVRGATRQAVRWAEDRPVWMVLQGHGRADWYSYARERLQLVLPEEVGPRPPLEALIEMARIALEEGADGIWWWSFELYDWNDPSHREFILGFRKVHQALREKGG